MTRQREQLAHGGAVVQVGQYWTTKRGFVVRIESFSGSAGQPEWRARAIAYPELEVLYLADGCTNGSGVGASARYHLFNPRNADWDLATLLYPVVNADQSPVWIDGKDRGAIALEVTMRTEHWDVNRAWMIADDFIAAYRARVLAAHGLTAEGLRKQSFDAQKYDLGPITSEEKSQ